MSDKEIVDEVTISCNGVFIVSTFVTFIILFLYHFAFIYLDQIETRELKQRIEQLEKR